MVAGGGGDGVPVLFSVTQPVLPQWPETLLKGTVERRPGPFLE